MTYAPRCRSHQPSLSASMSSRAAGSRTASVAPSSPGDECAGAAATRHARSRVVTAFVDELSFLAPVYVGDFVTARASVNHVGKTSMEVGVRVDAENLLTGKVVHVSSAYLVFVGIDEKGGPMPLPPLTAETDEERRRMKAAEGRRAHRLKKTAPAS